MKRSMFMLPLVAVVATLFSGCAQEQKPDGLPDLYPCTLTLTQDGQPLAGATVQVLSADADGKWSAGGTTDEQGKVILVTYGKYQGVQAGKHKVVVSKQESDVPEGEMEAGIVVPGSGGGGTLPTSYTLVEKEYTSQETTPLELEIVPDQDNDQTFECGKAIREKI